MPWWAILYLGLFGLLAVGGLENDMENRRPAWYLGCAVLSGATIMYLFVAYWQPWLRAIPGAAVPLAFAAAAGWALYQLFDNARSILTDPGISSGVGRAAVGFVVTFSLPMFVTAGISAFGG